MVLGRALYTIFAGELLFGTASSASVVLPLGRVLWICGVMGRGGMVVADLANAAAMVLWCFNGLIRHLLLYHYQLAIGGHDFSHNVNLSTGFQYIQSATANI